MKRQLSGLAAFTFIIFAGLGYAETSAAESNKTNFVFFLVDDMGWADVGCFGSKFHETPNIDKLAESGMRFTAGYAACPVCSPTRASIITGRHPVRVNITDWIPGSSTSRYADAKFKHINDRDNLALKEVTIAEVLKGHGYQTFFGGKWHLGDKGHWPTDQGFDFNIGGNSKGSPPGGYYSPWTNPTLKAKHTGEYVTERLTEESIKFLNERDEDKPFLLYLAYYNIHTPIQPYKKRMDHFEGKGKKTFEGATPTQVEHNGNTRMRQDNAALASMVSAVDISVGAILDRLEELKIDDNTVVCFFSDNGGLSTLRKMGPGCNLPLRAGKGWLYEGGIREPTIIRAPGVAKKGGVCDTPICSTDFFPTILDLAGLPLMPETHADGVSVRSLLQEDGDFADRALYWHYPHYHGSTWKPGAAIRDGDWKLIEFYHYDKVELYNVKNDIEEKVELSGKHPEMKQKLLAKLHAWQKQMKAHMPVPK
jgi:arylsulfatase A-like enzyme